MRALEQAAIASGRVTGLALMERAGQGVVEAILDTWPDLSGGARRAVVLCGPGNNGGDGFVVARLLHECGWICDVSLFGDPDKLPPDAARNYARWIKLGDVACRCDYDDPWEWRDIALGNGHHVFVDALFGIGLARPLEGILEALTGYIGKKRRGSFSRVVAVDIPSGLDSDTGAVLGHADSDEALIDMRQNGRSFRGFRAITADLTVTFHRPKHGHLRHHGLWMCGKRVVKDIGL